jgi:hypothetical protein
MSEPTYRPVAAPEVRPAPSRDPVLLGTAWVAGIAAAVASYSALYQLAVLAGWSPRVAFLFPLTIDAYAVAALRVWLGRATSSSSARRRARRAAVGAIVASMAGNATLHAAIAHEFRITWPVVVAVSAVPPVTLGLVSHLFALRAAPGEGQVVSTEPGAAELAAMSKAEAIRVALAHTGGSVLAAQAWLADHGVNPPPNRAYMHDVKRNVSGKRRRNRPAAIAAVPEPEGAAA